MKTFYVTVEEAGYCRGRSTYQVEAENEEEATRFWHDGVEIGSHIVRDDREREVESIREVEPIREEK